MANKVLSIELGNSTMRICQLDYKTSNPRVYHHLVIPTPADSINDGYLKNPNAIAEEIKRALADNSIKGTKNVIFTIASTKIVTREQLLPQMKPTALNSLIQNNLSEYFPIDLDKYVVTHTVLGTVIEGKDQGKMRVMIMAAEKELVNAYHQLAQMCGLTLLMLDQVGNSVYQVVKNEDKESCKMIFKIEEEQTNVTVVKGDSLLLQRNVGFGIDAAVQEVMKQPAFASSRYEQAWDVIRDRVCINSTLDAGGRIEQKDAAAEADYEEAKQGSAKEGNAMVAAKAEVTESLTDLIKGLQRVLNYYNSTNSSNPVDRIVICGVGGRVNGLSKLISNELEIPTSKLRKLESVKYHVLGDDADLYNYAACIGATYAPVGFYSVDVERKKKNATNYKAVSGLIAVFTIVVAATVAVMQLTKLKEVQDRATELKATEQKYLEAEKVYQSYENMLALYTEVSEGVALMHRPSNEIVSFISELEANLPASTTVSQYSSSDTAFVMSLDVSTKEEAIGLIESMRTFESLDNVSVAALSEIRGEEIPIVTKEDIQNMLLEDPDLDPEQLKVTEFDSDGLPIIRTGIISKQVDGEGNTLFVRDYVQFTVTCTYAVKEVAE